MNNHTTNEIALPADNGQDPVEPMAGVPERASTSHLSPLATAASRGWPPVCTLAELGRILTMVYGVKAPTASTLKKWSAAGEFRSCIASAAEIDALPSSLAGSALARPSRGGRPGLRLRTAAAIGRVDELWPFLADSDHQAVLELAVARTADHFRSAIAPAIGAASTAPQGIQFLAPSEDAAGASLASVQEQIASLAQEMSAVRRELAQFSALRNNLITRLDDVVARTKEAVAATSAGRASGSDPLAEARRDRDMGLMKSTLAEILAALERIEASGTKRI